MLNNLISNLTNSGVVETTSISTTVAVTTMLVAFVLGVIISITYIGTAEPETYSHTFCYTLVMVPIVSAIIILLVGSNLATAFSVSGAFALVRFRSEPGNPKNIAYIFATVAAGLACGVQCYLYATIFTIFLCFILLVFSKINFGSRKIVTRKLRVLIPETLDYEGVFEETLAKYTTSSELERIGTLDLGSTFELVYDIVMKDNTQTKELIDELRCLNCNLTVSVYLNPRKSEK